jgi:metallo-beta-lactamase class B
MNMKNLCLFLLSLLIALPCLNAIGQGQSPATSPPPAANAARPPAGGRDMASSVRMFNAWKPAIEPRHIIGNIYYVGMVGVSSWLITTPQGNILIDTAFEESVPLICTNIEKLGFHVNDIKYILSSHTHVDHTGGHALMKKITGASIVASAADAHILETGGADDFSPFPKELLAYTPVKADRIVKDGDELTLGGVTLTAHLTPGHTKGATTWTMPVKDGDKTYNVAFFSSVSIAQPTPLLNNPAYTTIVEDYAETFKKLKALPCDIFLAPHADQFGFADKLRRLDQGASPNPFIDPAGWNRLITQTESTYLRQLANEKAGK